MTLFEAVTLIMFIIMVILCIAQTATIILWHRKVKKYDNKIPINHGKTDSYIWIGVALVNIAAESYMLIDSIPTYNYNPKTNGYLYIILMWTAFLTYIFLPTVFVRKHYITPKCMLIQGAKNDIYVNEDVQYRIDGNVLELYCQKSKNTLKYKITEQKDKLVQMLSDNYKQYTKTEKEKKS